MKYYVEALPYYIPIGKVGENKYRSVEIDIGKWLEEYPTGVVNITYKRPDGIVYVLPASMVEKSLVWEPRAMDVAVSGSGEIELMMTSGEVIGKSAKVKVQIDETICPSGEIPDPYESWYNDIVSAGNKAEQFTQIASGGEAGQVWMKTETGVQWISVSDIPEVYMNRMGIEKIAPYVFNGRQERLEYEKAKEFFETYKPEPGACSVVSKGNLVGRNFDYPYDEKSEFVIHTPAKFGRHAVIGIAKASDALTQEEIERESYHEEYRLMPFLLRDGVNDAGLFCEINECPTGDKGITTGTHPGLEDLCELMLTRFVLDNAGSVDEAIALLGNRNVYAPHNGGMKQEFHFLLKDPAKTVVIEFVDNEMKVIDTFVDEKEIMTNFYLYGYNGSKESLTDYAVGIERYEILSAGYENAESVEDMLSLLRSVKYTKTYSDEPDPVWLSEFNGDWRDTEFGVNLTKDSPASAYTGIRSHYKQAFQDRTRNGETWHTIHTVVYDIERKTLLLAPQEGNEVFSFSLASAGRVY